MSSTEPKIPSGAVFSIAPVVVPQMTLRQLNIPSPMSSESEDAEYEYHLEVKVTTSEQDHPDKVYPNKLDGRIINQSGELIVQFELSVTVFQAEIAICLIINDDDTVVSTYTIPRWIFPSPLPCESDEEYHLEVKVTTSEQDHPDKVYPNQLDGRIINQSGELIGELELSVTVFQAELAICLIINDDDELVSTFTIPRFILRRKGDGKVKGPRILGEKDEGKEK
jgi:hypothetical protein